MALKRSFDHLARPYRTLERLVFGTALQTARVAHLAALQDARNVLVLGEGDGRCLERLLETAPRAVVDVVDKSPRMLELAQRRVFANPRVRIHCADAREFSGKAPYDAIVTCFFLDCFEEAALKELIATLSSWLSPEGLWLYSDFRSGDGAHSPLRNRMWLWTLYRAFGLVTDIESRRLVDPSPFFRAHGLERRTRITTAGGLLTSELWQATPQPERSAARLRPKD
jgi:SAM-dependent methyltransferase